jgi:hypothetical protein
MEIYQEQHGDEEAEEEQEVENFKRRISRPKIQFSPVPEIKKRILKKPKFKLNMSIRLNTGQTLNPFINDSSTSAYTSRENSFLDERDFVGFDRLTQRELREQLGRIKPRNFLLPHYKNLRTVLENGSDSLSDNYLNNNRFFLDSSLDEQEEIHLLEPTRVEEEDNFFGTSQHEILENSSVFFTIRGNMAFGYSKIFKESLPEWHQLQRKRLRIVMATIYLIIKRQPQPAVSNFLRFIKC